MQVKNGEGRNRPSSYIFRAFRNVDDVTLKNNPRSPLSSTISISKTLSLEKLNLSGRYMKLQKSLDAFLFCCYAGMRYSDFTNLSSENIVDINQETWLIYKSVKTGTEVRLPLYLLFAGKGIIILNKYLYLRGVSNVSYVLQ